MISVLLTTYNDSKYIPFSIRSILDQTFPHFELIIIDDGSTDNTYEVINIFKDDRIKYYYIDHIGRSAALNHGIKKCVGKYIAIIDADDWAYPDRLLTQFNFLENNTQYSLVGTYAELIDEKGNHISKLTRPISFLKIYKNLFALNSICFGTIMFNKEVALSFSFNDKVTICEDLDWFVKVLPKYKASNIPKNLMKLTQRVNSRYRNNNIDYSYFVKSTSTTIKRKLLSDNFENAFIDYMHLGCLNYYYGKLDYAKYYFNKSFMIKKLDIVLWRYLIPLKFFDVKKLKKSKIAKIFAVFYRKLQNVRIHRKNYLI